MKNYSLKIKNLKKLCFNLSLILLLANSSTTLASIISIPSKTNGSTFCSALIKPVLNKDKAKKNVAKKATIITTTVSSVAALQTAVNNAASGDVIVLADGTYLNGTLTIAKSNITVRAATPGGVYWNSNVNLQNLMISPNKLSKRINITGSDVTFSGFQFTSGDIGAAYIIEVSGSRNTLTHLNFSGYHAQKYIRITDGSQYNEISYCNIEKKPAAAVIGCTIQITTDPVIPGYHKIRYCSFQEFYGAGGDFGNEPIRIGLSTENNNASRSIIEYCYFNNTGLGDSETVSIKSKENTIRYCTFTNQQNAMLCFRNGDNNAAYSNFFINAGGIRVKEANNIYCYNNYFYNSGSTSGSSSANAVTLLYVAPIDLRTSNLVNVNFVHNTFVDCMNIDLGGIGATNNTWANNIFKKTSGNIFMNPNSGTTFVNNIYQGNLGITIPSGMNNSNPNLTLNTDGYYGLSSTSPVNNSSSNYPSLLDLTNVDDDPNLLLDISGQSRPSLITSKDIGCDEFTTGTTSNHPLVLAEAGPSYLEVNYKTTANGNFNDASIWQTYNSITTPTTATNAPTGVNNITITSGNEVTLTTDINFASKKTLTVNGKLTTGGKNFTLSAGANAIFGPSSELLINGGTTNFNALPVTFQSNTTGTAKIGTITGSLLGATNVTLERYISAKRGWRALTAPVVGGANNSIFYNWQNNGIVIPNTGIEIWSNASTDQSVTNTGNGSSLLSYNSSSNNWISITNTNSTPLFSATVNNPFMVFVTGPYATTSTNIVSGAAATTLKATGTLLTGNQFYTCLASKYTFIGNPYASPLNLTTMLGDPDNAAFNGKIWIWDANSTGNSVGTYNLFNAGTYSNLTTNPLLSATTLIQSGQAFFVRSTAAASFSIKETHKGATFSNAIFRDAAPAELLRVGLYKQINTEWSGRDGAMAVFMTDADANQTGNKMANGTENIAFTKNAELFASEHHLPLVASDELNIRVWNTSAGANYKLKINTEQFTVTNLEATLEDVFTNSRTPIILDGTAVEYPFSVTTEAASTGNRFRIVFENAALGINITKAMEIKILPNPIASDTFQVNLGTLSLGEYTFSIRNALGQEIEKGLLNNVSQNTNHVVIFKNDMAAGMYIMKVTGTDNTMFTIKLIKN